MLPKVVLTATTAMMAWSPLAMAAPRIVEARSASELSLTAQLRLADTAIDRFKLLPEDKDFVYDFDGKDAAIATASGTSFPALVGTGASLFLGEFGPCSMAIVHSHPRAAELFAVISGNLTTEMVPESGVVDSEGNQRVIRTELGPGQMTVFYQGSFHTQMNSNCEAAKVVTAFPSEDMGAALIANNAFALSDKTIANMFGQVIKGEDIEKVRHALPEGVASKVDACLAKCGIEKRQA
ncbi:RmlC-like cupin domain-containing protein [Thelonectria olida]|uniref:RmlC-like cupin domain-containing protein n=1 Tax=Thelonectria olida TaxID=1576542 RepID=A0A9P8WIM8_9HYPO|nr:RmlC-like cupin domain-containing protein [Thelonectria olida]